MTKQKLLTAISTQDKSLYDQKLFSLSSLSTSDRTSIVHKKIPAASHQSSVEELNLKAKITWLSFLGILAIFCTTMCAWIDSLQPMQKVDVSVTQTTAKH